MKNHIAFLLCGATGLLAWNTADAAPSPSAPAPVQSFADLLEPIPKALVALIADDLARAHQPKPLLQLAQYHHHHHHHHHSFYPTIITTTTIITAISAAGSSSRLPRTATGPTATSTDAS